ncbi:pilus assembly protein TadB [Vibrio sp. S9_S30]|uniref:type II secretion system F family protein n=1 Tax=Vibrio sp. S9_S30 TaxID=2720226 RepID=UPI0016816364|nr:type II secretion system F family protein [Vibrio sp. S9_S30]MBD1556169.1 pilus assembly protein TadB [Vibrio sp. S9_S30]
MMYVAVVLIWFGLMSLFLKSQKAEENWSKQLERYGKGENANLNKPTPSFLEKYEWYKQCETLIEPDTLKKWKRVTAATMVALPIVLFSNGMPLWFSLLLSVAVIVSGLWFGYYQAQQKAIEAFRLELPDVIDGLLRAIRVGAPLADTFLVISQQHSGVIARLFFQIHAELGVGQTMQETMANAAKRMPIPEFRFLTIVMSLQQETGGRLSDVLSRLRDTLRSRRELSASIKSITSESRNSAKVLAALPCIVALVLFTTGREHFNFLMTTHTGQMVVAYVIASVLVGLYLIRRLTQLKG